MNKRESAETRKRIEEVTDALDGKANCWSADNDGLHHDPAIHPPRRYDIDAKEYLDDPKRWDRQIGPGEKSWCTPECKRSFKRAAKRLKEAARKGNRKIR